ncbi:hypothetical protein [Rhodococcus qingshengii]|uniref:hypothetical protein n=1 Tax=Rhodococcus qingshengii TaxID=334542 RepID=UPI001F13CF65|nr:hypothetical protein [Rhodococcus qingshengii]ULD38944.1 hypothetical protein JKI97_00040 [Rhodococcus qingshengii]
MSQNSGGTRGFWYEGDPLVVISGLGDASATEVEASFIDSVNQVMEIAEDVGVDAIEYRGGTDLTSALTALTNIPPTTPPAAPAAPAAPVPPMRR